MLVFTVISQGVFWNLQVNKVNELQRMSAKTSESCQRAADSTVGPFVEPCVLPHTSSAADEY